MERDTEYEGLSFDDTWGAHAEGDHLVYRGYIIKLDPPPIPTRGWDYEFVHVDYDGPEDKRCGRAASVQDAERQIDELEADELLPESKNNTNITREELNMEKIKNLLEQAGVKPELAKQICESLNTYKTTLREQFEAEYAAKVQEAKKVCIEETEAHKRELARRLQIFCEAKGAAIEAQLAKQSALSESEALTKLKSVKALLEGIAINGGTSGQSTAVIEKAKKQVQLATEEKKRAIETANRQTAIAERALKENRRLTTEIAKLKETAPVTEGKRPKSGQRLDQGRKAQGQPVSTRATLLENQDPRTPAKANQPNTTRQGNGYGIPDIAEMVDEDLV